MSTPDFFIVGAPKCGTTALAKYLGENPGIFFSDPKEPHYFAKDFHGYQPAYTTDWEKYLELYSGRTPNQLQLGEGSVWYLYSDNALKNIRRSIPDAKLIVMVREPADLLHSLHSQLLWTQDEDVEDFEEAWRLQDQRLAGSCIPKGCNLPKVLQYRDIARLGSQLKRARQIFPAHQIMTIVFDDFVADPAAIYRKVCSFLGVADDERTEFPRVNENKSHRWKALGSLLYAPPQIVKQPVLALKRLLGKDELWTEAVLKKFNMRTVTRTPLREDFRVELRGYFRDECILLGRLLNRDLSGWFDL